MIDRGLKAVAIGEFSQLKHNPAGTTIHKLISILLADKREDNDIATGDEVRHNQGQIDAYKQLLTYLDRGVPGSV